MFNQTHGCLPKQKWITKEPETLFFLSLSSYVAGTLKVTISTYH